MEIQEICKLKQHILYQFRGGPNGGFVPNFFSYFWLGTDRKDPIKMGKKMAEFGLPALAAIVHELY